MPADIERIVDRKLIKQRVHYYVVWKGFGEENNTWESRMDLIADGYHDVIKDFEDQRKKEGGSTPRGRSPRRSTSKSPRKSKSPGRSPGRPRGRRSRSRSVSMSRKLPETDDESSQDKELKATTPRRRAAKSNNENNGDSPKKETPRRRSNRKQETTFVSRQDNPEDEDDSFVTRSTIAALVPQVREMAPVISEVEVDSRKKVTLAYEEEDESVLLPKTQSKHAEEVFSPTSAMEEHATAGGVDGVADKVNKLLEGGWFVSFLSVAAVVASLVASQVLPRSEDGVDSSDLWRRWLPFLIPIVAVLLYFHQKDARASAMWVASGLTWRIAAELLLYIGSTPRDYETMAFGAAAIANVFLVGGVLTILRKGEHAQSKATLALLTLGVLGLFLSDSWVITTENPELDSRVILMSMALLTIALSPKPTASSEDDD